MKHWQSIVYESSIVWLVGPSLVLSQEVELKPTEPPSVLERQAEADRAWLIAHTMNDQSYRWNQIKHLESRYQRMSPLRLRTLVLYYQNQQSVAQQRISALQRFRERAGGVTEYWRQEQSWNHDQSMRERRRAAAFIAQNRVDQLRRTSFESFERKRRRSYSYDHSGSVYPPNYYHSVPYFDLLILAQLRGLAQ